MKKFASQLKGQRITLKKKKPTLETAKSIFQAVDNSREHLEVWFPWAKTNTSVEEQLKFLFQSDEKMKTGKLIAYGIYLKNEYIGNIAIFDIDPKLKSGEIGYWLSVEHTRKGYMTEALRLIEAEAFGKVGFHRLQIRCDSTNLASIGVAQKCGYIFEGTFRENAFNEHFKEYRSTSYYSKLISEYNPK